MRKKIIILFTILITLFTIGVVPKQFQNDTFFNISIGKYILENGIDMQEHFSWISGLTYTYSHWAFDILTYIIYAFTGFTGIYISVIVIAIIMNVTLFILLTKRTNNPLIALTLTLLSAYLAKGFFTARSQIISFVCFIIEIYCIEKFIETNKKKYAIILIILSIIIANFHAATWPLYLVLFLPYLASAFMNVISAENIYSFCKNRAEKKLKELPNDSPKYSKYLEDVNDYSKLIERSQKKEHYKIIRNKQYNSRNLIILMVIIALTGLLTPIHDVPYTYILNSMLGPSNIENHASIDFIAEMQPIIPATSMKFIIFSALLIGFLLFLPTKLKSEHAFLLLGLLLMTLSSNRYIALLIFLGNYVLADLITQAYNSFISNDVSPIEKFLLHPIIVILLIISFSSFSTAELLEKIDISYTDESFYPVGATNYILENLDYKNIKIYNSYNTGSYLMFHNIPVFIDSRLDVYCSEFNNTDVFHDYISISNDTEYYEDIFSKYNFSHILLSNDDLVYKYIKRDSNYKLLYEDENFTLFERNVSN